MSDEKILTKVEKYSHLYDLSNKYYYGCIKKDNSWLEIDNNLKISGNYSYILLSRI